MTNPMHAEIEISRRKFLAMGGAVAAAGTVGPWIDPLSAWGSTRWPTAGLSARDAIRVRQGQFHAGRPVREVESRA
jgi:TAT (twin-arginine translocation) pathway signal sequence